MSVAKQLKVKEGDKLDWEFASENGKFMCSLRAKYVLKRETKKLTHWIKEHERASSATKNENGLDLPFSTSSAVITT
jgi:hypothetical protein